MSKIYLHSVQRDFAPTQVLPEPAYLGRCLKPGRLTYIDCGCPAKKWMRISRLWWMRVLPFFRLYRCLHCGLRVFRPRIQQRGLYSAVYLPPRPIQSWNVSSALRSLRAPRSTASF